MTTNIIIKSHESNHNEAIVKVTGQPDLNLQPGHNTTVAVYPGRTITVDEGEPVAKSGDEQAAADKAAADAPAEGTAAAEGEAKDGE